MPLPSDAAPGPLVHSAFYRFTPIADPVQAAAALRQSLQALGGDALGGSILLAAEGINGTVAGSGPAVARFEQLLQQAPGFGGALAGLPFRRSGCSTPPFGRMKVHVRSELVQLGVAGVDARSTGTNVSPQDWRALIRQPDVVLLDNRNSFEFRLGHFEGAVDPQVANFRDFPAYVRAHAAQWKAQGRRVAMYCTGGIRCEKTSAWMRTLGVDAWQLEGGILGYFEQVPDAERDFRGACFVFDNRVALDTRLQEAAMPLEAVYAGGADSVWRLARARRLAQAAAA